MALVNIVSFTFRDASGKTKSLPFFFPATATLANMQAWITAVAPELGAVSDANIESVSVTVGATLPNGLPAAVAEGNRVREGALFSCSAANTKYKEDFYIPAWKELYFNVDDLTSDTEVTDLIASFTASGAGTEMTNRHGDDITGVANSGRTFRK